jgi:hypothetical protein
MAGVLNGQPVSAEITNPAFIIKNADDVTPSGLGLASSVTARGSFVTDLQTDHNAIWSFIGGLINQVKTYVPSWTSQNFGGANATIKDKIEAIDAAFSVPSGSQTYRSQRVALSSGVSSVTVVFTTAWADSLFVPMLTFENIVDSQPIFLQGIVTARSTAGFTVTLNAATDSSNYYLSYTVRKPI